MGKRGIRDKRLKWALSLPLNMQVKAIKECVGVEESRRATRRGVCLAHCELEVKQGAGYCIYGAVDAVKGGTVA